MSVFVARYLISRERLKRPFAIIDAPAFISNALLPGRFPDSRDLSFICQVSEADTADTVFLQNRVRSAAYSASCVSPSLILRLSLLFNL